MSHDENYETFLEEAFEGLGRIEMEMLGLERAPNDLELINSVFRVLHTIKDNAKVFGLHEVQNVTHEIESVFDALRKGESRVTNPLIDLTLSSCDLLHNLLTDPTPEDSIRTKEAQEIIDALQQLTPSDSAPLSHNKHYFQMQINPAPDVFDTASVDPTLLLGNLKQIGQSCHIVADTEQLLQTLKGGGLEQFEHKTCHTPWKVQLETLANQETLEDLFCFEDGFKLEFSTLSAPLTTPQVEHSSAVIVIDGEQFNFESSHQVTEQIEQFIQVGTIHITLDCSHLKIISSMGLGVLTNIQEQLEPLGGSLSVIGVSNYLYKLMKLTKMDQLIKIRAKV